MKHNRCWAERDWWDVLLVQTELYYRVRLWRLYTLVPFKTHWVTALAPRPHENQNYVYCMLIPYLTNQDMIPGPNRCTSGLLLVSFIHLSGWSFKYTPSESFHMTTTLWGYHNIKKKQKRTSQSFFVVLMEPGCHESSVWKECMFTVTLHLLKEWF